MEIDNPIQELQLEQKVKINRHNIGGLRGNHAVVQPCSSTEGIVIATEGSTATAQCKAEIQFNKDSKDNPDIAKIRCSYTQTVKLNRQNPPLL